ncbi:MAG: MBL fold metallo-hydrolase [Acidimicrobiia bacterium]
MRVHLCGVRGSMPSTGLEFAGVGGNTSCVAIAHDGELPRLVLDAGTGLRILAKVLGATPFRGTILLGHLHWDHVMGLPFFPPGDHPDAKVRMLLPEQGVEPIALLGRAMSPPFFPITPKDLRGDWQVGTFDEGRFEAEGFDVLAREIPHKGSRTMGLRISDGTSSIAYLSDHSPHDLGVGDHGYGVLHDAAMELASGVDLLIHDAQYTMGELANRFTWGHAAADFCVALAEASGAKKVLLFHHDPWRTDEAVAALRDVVAASATIPVEFAVEGSVIDLGRSAHDGSSR